jgi:hypothetical protein
VILDGLLLHGRRPPGEPGVVCTGLGELSAPFHKAGRVPPTGAVLVLLLHAQVPDEPGVSAVPEQDYFLITGRLETI